MSKNNDAATLPTPEDLTLDEISQRFNTDEKAVAYLEALLWPHGPVCPHCGNTDAARIYKIKANVTAEVRVGLHECAQCKRQFRVTVGTIFEDSKIPLRKWLVAFYMVSSSKKGISSLQLQRNLGLGSYRTALFMTHRIRYALTSPQFTEPLKGDVEVDSTFVGGKTDVKAQRKLAPTFEQDATGKWVRRPLQHKKMEVLSLQERGGQKRSIVMRRVSSKELLKAIEENVAPGSTIHSDSTQLLKRKPNPKYEHKIVNHSKKEYARKLPDGRVTHVNTLESSFGLLKRGLYATFHSVSKKHLHRYVAEFDFRWNARKKTDGERTVAAVRGTKGKRLMLKEPKTNNPT